MLIAENNRRWGTPHVERACFGTGEPSGVVRLDEAFCLKQLGAAATDLGY